MGFVNELLDAHDAGARAAREEAPRSSCPHPPDSSDPRTRNAFVAWMRGYASVTPTPVDYSG